LVDRYPGILQIIISLEDLDLGLGEFSIAGNGQVRSLRSLRHVYITTVGSAFVPHAGGSDNDGPPEPCHLDPNA
jgi:hypothetical protein